MLLTETNPIEAVERSLLSLIINSCDESVIFYSFERIEPKDFYNTFNRKIFEDICALVIYKNQKIDKSLLLSKLKKAKDQALFSDICSTGHEIQNLSYYVEEIKNASSLRNIKSALLEANIKIQTNPEIKAGDLASYLEDTLISAVTTNKFDFVTLRDALPGIIQNLKSGRKEIQIHSGFVTHDEYFGGIPNDYCILAARPSMGKAQPLDAKILLSNGEYISMGDIKIGDSLASIDGKSSTVCAIFPQGKKNIYKITFSDGRSTECCEDHLWKINHRTWKEGKILTTKQLIEKLSHKKYKNRLYIDLINGEFGNNVDLKIDPYVLGCLIGDGSFTRSTPKFSTADEQIISNMKEKLGPITRISKTTGKYDYLITEKFSKPNYSIDDESNLINCLKFYGLHGHRSENKFIPKEYLSSSLSNRIDLLKGLLDTDGTVTKDKSVSYSTSSFKLALDVQNLVRSVGGLCKIKTKKTPRLDNYICRIRIKNSENYFSLDRKLSRCEKTKHLNPRLNITSIEFVGEKEAQCIKVTHPTSLYITDNYIVTHNTEMAIHMMVYNAKYFGKRSAFFSLEMDEDLVWKRVISTYTKIPFEKINTHTLDDYDMKILEAAIPEIESLPIHIDATPGLSAAAIMSKAKRLKIKYPDLAFVVIDYIQLISSNDVDSQERGLTKISLTLMNMRKVLQVPLLVLSQLSRNLENREDKRPRLSDLRGSGSLEQDAAVIMFLYEGNKYDPSEPEGRTEVIVSKNRHGKVGTIIVQNDKETQTFYEPTEQAGIVN